MISGAGFNSWAGLVMCLLVVLPCGFMALALVLMPLLMAPVLLVLSPHCGRGGLAWLSIAVHASGTVLSMMLVAQSVLCLLPGWSCVGHWLLNVGFAVHCGLLVDDLASLMCLLVEAVLTLVMLYSMWYLSADGSTVRFYAVLQLFAASMCMIALGDGLVAVFLG